MSDIQFRRLSDDELSNLRKNAGAKPFRVIIYGAVPIALMLSLTFLCGLAIDNSGLALVISLCLFIFIVTLAIASDSFVINKHLADGDCSCCKFIVVDRKEDNDEKVIRVYPEGYEGDKVMDFDMYLIEGTLDELNAIDSFYAVRFGTNLYRFYQEKTIGIGV